MLYVQLDTNWPDHPKIIRAGIDGAGLHAIVLCLAKRLESDGWVDRAVLYRQGATDELIGRLVDVDLLEADGDRVRPDGWHDRNPSQAAIAASRASKREAAIRGNHNRWHPGVRFEECDKCQVIAGSDRTGSQDLSTTIAPDRTPTSRGIAEVDPAIAPCDHPLAQRAAAHADTGSPALRSQLMSPGLPDPSRSERSAPASPLPPVTDQPEGRNEA